MSQSRSLRRCLPLLFALLLVQSASAEWKEQVLYSFQGTPDGSVPVGSVVFDKAGSLYGATTDGGSSSCQSIVQCGTVYQLTPPVQKGDAWTETVLYIFKGNASNDGATPAGGLVIDGAGNLYGTTAYGGTGDCVLLGTKMGCGAVFELSPPAQKGGGWTETVLYSFPSSTRGYLPRGDLVFDSAGNLYGATEFGGGKGNSCDSFYQYCGEVFKLSPPKKKGGAWTEKVLHSFSGLASGNQTGDGANPEGGLLLDSKGTIYGSTPIGGYNCPQYQGAGCGTVFKLSPPAKKSGEWTENILHRFTDGDDGSGPHGDLVFDAKGAFYGAAGLGGTGELGVVFRMAPKAGGRWVETVLHNFTVDKGGRNPWGVIHDSFGNLYGTAGAAASDKVGGVVFVMRPETHGKWSFAVLYNFAGAPDGNYPVSRLVLKSRDLYSTTQIGGTGPCQGGGGCGTVFEVSPP